MSEIQNKAIDSELLKLEPTIILEDMDVTEKSNVFRLFDRRFKN